MDYRYRCKRKLKDKLSRRFRQIYKSHAERVQLDEDILEGWAEDSTAPRQLISELRGAFHFRHWLAHGRYWEPKLGRKYDYNYLFLLAEAIINAFDLKGD